MLARVESFRSCQSGVWAGSAQEGVVHGLLHTAHYELLSSYGDRMIEFIDLIVLFSVLLGLWEDLLRKEGFKCE